METITLLIILNILMLIAFLGHIVKCKCGRKVEGFDTDETGPQPDISDSGLSEAVQNVASLYNDKTLVIDNLKVTGNIEVQGESKLGQWRVKDRSLGINGTGDLHWHDDGWLRQLPFGTDDITKGLTKGGFGADSLWTGSGKINMFPVFDGIKNNKDAIGDSSKIVRTDKNYNIKLAATHIAKNQGTVGGYLANNIWNTALAQASDGPNWKWSLHNA